MAAASSNYNGSYFAFFAYHLTRFCFVDFAELVVILATGMHATTLTVFRLLRYARNDNKKARNDILVALTKS